MGGGVYCYSIMTLVLITNKCRLISPNPSEASPTSAVIYQLQFKNKKETAKGHQFERLTELVER